MHTHLFRKQILTLLLCLWGGWPLHAARAEGRFTEHIVEAVRCYENLDYELALEQLQQARKLARTTEDTVTIALYEGIIQAELGHWDESRIAFREALRGRADAQLPQRVSPKLMRVFESQRSLVQDERKPERQPGAEARTGGAPAPGDLARGAMDRPETGPVLVPSVTEPPGLEAVASEPPPVEVRSGRVPVLTWALLGVGVAAGGAGAVFGLSSRSQLEDARNAQFRSELTESHSRSQRSALTANVLFGAAGAAAAGAVVSWLMGGGATESGQGVAR